MYMYIVPVSSEIQGNSMERIVFSLARGNAVRPREGRIPGPGQDNSISPAECGFF